MKTITALYQSIIMCMLFVTMACSTANDPVNDDTPPQDDITGATEPQPPTPARPGDGTSTQLIVCGDDKVLMIDSEKALADGYAAATVWSWSAKSAAATLGLDAARLNHIDECKPVDNATKLLVTSSCGWCALIDCQTQQVLFHTTQTPQAHSAELLPGNLIAVACSSGSGNGYNSIRLYEASRPNVCIGQYPLTSAHGVVWHPATNRLYATGNNTLQTYKLIGHTLTPESTVTTPQNGVHDLITVDDNTLLVAGRKGCTYDIKHKAYTAIKLFNNSTALKSVNYNPQTRELWYTDATEPEGDYTWSTHTLRWARDPSSTPSAGHNITIPNMNIYKVRVAWWGTEP